jgi:hypothetical protein
MAEEKILLPWALMSNATGNASVVPFPAVAMLDILGPS